MPLNDAEKIVVRKVLEEMKNAHDIIAFWLTGSAIELTLKNWIKTLEGLLEGLIE